MRLLSRTEGTVWYRRVHWTERFADRRRRCEPQNLLDQILADQRVSLILSECRFGTVWRGINIGISTVSQEIVGKTVPVNCIEKPLYPP